METAGRDIHKPEDLFLLLRIYRAQGKYDDAMKVIDTAQQKKMAPILANNWEVARQMIELTVLAQQWGKLFSYCSDILVDSFRAPLEPSSAQAIRWGRLGDDWKVWQALLTANESINSEL